MTALRLGSILTLLTVAQGREHKITFYADVDFEGSSVEITLQTPTAVGNCNTLAADWSRRVSSVNPRENCYEFFDQAECKGNILYIFPGSPGHNNLTDLGFNDRMQSFRLCDLDEERFDAEDCPVGFSCRRSMHSSRPERWFWEFFFRNFNTNMCNMFLNRISRENFILWDFIPGIGGSKGQQYRGAVEWVMDLAEADKINREKLDELRRRAADVLSNRDTRNAIYGKGTNSASAAIHFSIANLWRTLVKVLDDAFHRNKKKNGQ